LIAALSTGKAVLIGIASGASLVLLVIGARANLGRPPKPPELDIPPAMQPGPSDPDLEAPLREKWYAWALLLVVILALWIPAVFLQEPKTNKADTVNFIDQSILRGHLTTLPGTEDNQLGFNCERCHGSGLGGGANVFNGALVKVPNLRTVCGGASTGHPLIKSLDDIVNTIAQGRANTDMPSWSVKFKGAMDDQQIEDVVNYILSIQQVPDDQNICLHAATSAAPSASPSGSGSASPSPSPSS
jgi:hypothetical protein